MSHWHHRSLQIAAAAALSVSVVSAAVAQSYPTRPVRIIVPTTAGATTDIIARLIAQAMGERLGQQFIIENRPGGGNTLGTEAVVRSAPDGYTVLLINAVNAINVTLFPKLNYDFSADIVPVAGIIRVPLVMQVYPGFPAKTVPEFIAYAKANPGKINMGSAGTGSTPHVAGELFKMMAGVDLLHVPYRGGAAAMTDLMSGQVQVMFEPVAGPLEHLRSGPAARARGDHDGALAGAAGCPDGGRVRPGLRGELVVRPRRAEGHADRDRRHAQPDGQCGARRFEAPGAIRRSRRHGSRWHAGRFCEARRRRDRKVGPGGEILRRQGGVTPHAKRGDFAIPSRAKSLPPRREMVDIAAPARPPIPRATESQQCPTASPRRVRR